MPKKGDKKKLTKEEQKRASAKISKLHKSEPEMPHDQKVAMSLEMAREHRLGPKGAYKPKKGKKK